MNKKLILATSLFGLILACAKKELPPKPLLPVLTPKVPVVKFVFVNRNGFRNDSTRHGFNDTVFQGPCLKVNYYDKKKNVSYLDAICYNRNNAPDNYPVEDSLVFGFSGVEKGYAANVGCEYQFIISLRWTWPLPPYTAKEFKYSSPKYPGTDTIKLARDTVIKFIWPDDTASGRYINIYRYP